MIKLSPKAVLLQTLQGKFKPPRNKRPNSILQLVKFLLSAGLFAALAPIAQATPADSSGQLRAHTATYSASSKQGSASSRRSLTVNSEGVWTLEQSVKLLIFRINEGSQFTINNGQIVPIKYHHTRNIGRKKNQEVFFNWAAMSASNNNDKDQWQSELDAGILDRMSLPLQIQLDLINGILDGSKDYKILDKGRIKTYTVEVVGFEKLNTALGARQLLKLRQYREDSDKEVISWLDPSQDYLMLHSQQAEDGDLITLEIESLTYKDQKPKASK